MRALPPAHLKVQRPRAVGVVLPQQRGHGVVVWRVQVDRELVVELVIDLWKSGWATLLQPDQGSSGSAAACTRRPSRGSIGQLTSSRPTWSSLASIVPVPSRSQSCRGAAMHG